MAWGAGRVWKNGEEWTARKTKVGGKRSSFLPTFVFRPLTPPYVRLHLPNIPCCCFRRFLPNMAWCHIVWDSLPWSWASSNFSMYTCVSDCEAIGQCLSASWVSPSVWTGSWDGHTTFSPIQSCKRYVLGTSSHGHSWLPFCRGLLSDGVSFRWTWSGHHIRAPHPSCFCRRLGCHLRNARTDDRGIGIHHPHFPQFPQNLHFHQLMNRADYVCSVPPPVRN